MINRQKLELLEKVRATLQFYESMNIAEIPLSPEIDRFLDNRDSKSKDTPVRPSQTKIDSPGRRDLLFTPAPESALNQPLAEICRDIDGCSRCNLHQNRQKIVTGHGSAEAKLFIVEDHPTMEEERKGHPFAGEAGELLDKMLKAIGLDRTKVYLTSIVKCKPLDNEKPTTDEIRICLNFLAREIAAVNPVIICAMGTLAAEVLTGRKQPLFRFRGKIHDFHGTPLIPSFHPSFLLKNPEMKKASWTDLQLILKKIS